MTDPTPGYPGHASDDDDAITTTLHTVPGLGAIPRPLLEAAQREAKALLNGDAAAAGSLVGLLGFFGLSSATGSLVLGLLGLLPGLVAYATTVYAQAQAAYRVWRDAERDVTPVAAPSSADGTPLVPVR